MKKRGSTLILILVFLVGLGLLLYPTVSDYYNSFHQSRAIASYAGAVSNMNTEEFDRMWEEAQAFNDDLLYKDSRFLLSDEDLARYNSVLDVTGTGIMGYIQIPKINVELPIYHGTDEAVLQIAIGHIEGTSLPVGGAGTHSVVSGHRGLPSAKLFSDLDQLREGDFFTIQVLDRTLTYMVDQIRIVLPSELNDLNIDPTKDYMTLVTCTPYGVNTHRMLVRGHRVQNEREQVRVTADALQIEPEIVAPFIAIPIILVLLIWMLTSTGISMRRKKKRAAEKEKEAAQQKNII